MKQTTVFLTGATGTMGTAFLRIWSASPERYPYKVKLLARPSRKNRKKLEPMVSKGCVEVIWGDLTNPADIRRGVDGADYVFHVGGLVSPQADYNPEATLRVNVGSMRAIVDAVRELPDPDSVKVVYIGSVSQLGMRHRPNHWGRTGDPVWGVKFDNYAESKIQAERILAESGLKYWVSLRQTAILSPRILAKGSDPITFHVPLRGVLEWVTEEDSGRLLANIPVASLPEKFWRNFYNVGGGESYRLTNYRMMELMMKSLHCPPPEKVFSAKWFALRNFHGIWYQDSDILEDYLHFRSGETAEEYFARLQRSLPWYFSLASMVPASLVKAGMRFVAGKKPFGPLYWRKTDNDRLIDAFFGSREIMENLPEWEGIPEDELGEPRTPAITLSHGYDETKPEEELVLEDMREAAHFRGGECMSASMTKGDIDTPLEWRCHAGHTFRATPRLVLKGGHWCHECLSPDTDGDYEAERNPFFAQIWDHIRERSE